jgi:hypothetical protein
LRAVANMRSICRAAEVGADDERAAAEGADLGGDGFGAAAIGVVVEDDVGAFAGAAEGEARPMPLLAPVTRTT